MTDTVPGRAEVHFDRHTPEYRHQFEAVTAEMQKCPVAWSDTYGGHWVISDHKSVFDLARDPSLLSTDKDVHGVRKGYVGVGIPRMSASSSAPS